MTILKRLPIIATVLAVICLMLPATPVAAANPVTVVLGGTGSSSWSITGIAPGDGGTKSVSVQNTGTGTGELRIWLSNLTGTEGTPAGFETPTPGDTGELAQYLTLRVTGSGLTSNITMPALPTAFPASAADAGYIKATLGTGQTINLTWTWSLPAATGNIVQGDGISFTINYTLNEVVAPPTTTTTTPPTTTTTPPTTTEPPDTDTPEPTTTPPTVAPQTTTPTTTTTTPVTTSPTTTTPTVTTTSPPTEEPSSSFEVRMFGSTRAAGRLTPQGRLKADLIAVSSAGDVTMAFPAGMLLTDVRGRPLAAIEAALFSGSVPSVPGQVVLGNIYELTCFDSSGQQTQYSGDMSMYLLSLPYQQSQVPEGTQSVYVGYFDAVSGRWLRLPSSPSPEGGRIQATPSHLSIFAVLADVSAPVHVPSAAFEIGAPTVQPASMQAGKAVTISAVVTNTGDAAGEYLVHAYIYGLLDTSELVTLAPGASQEVSFTVVPQVAGFYTATIEGQHATFTVTEAVSRADEIRAFIREHLADYVGLSVVLMLVIGLVGASIFSGKRP